MPARYCSDTRMYVSNKRVRCLLVLLVSTVAILVLTTTRLHFHLSPFAQVIKSSSSAANASQGLLYSIKSRTGYQDETNIISQAQSTLGHNSYKSIRGDSDVDGVARRGKHRDNLIQQEVTTHDVFEDTDAAPLFEPVDLMKEEPLKYLPNYKNPCWRSSGSNPPISCLPYVYLAGFPKCGTTDIYNRIISHPEVAKPKSKESHWITRMRFRNREERTLKNYTDIYCAVAAKAIYRSVNANNYHNKITGDFSASTIFDNHYWRALPENGQRDEPLYTNADYIHHTNPRTKIIVMIREPINRLYSDYLYFWPNRKANTTHQQLFHNLVQAKLAHWNSCLENKTFRYCLYTGNDGTDKIPTARIRIGMYSEHIAELLRVFPREQVLVIKLEDYSLDPSTTMQHVFKFLNITLLSAAQKNRIGNPGVRMNQNRVHSSTVPMWEATKRLLVKFYKPYNEKLGELLDDERFNYNYMYSAVKN